jgi:molybdopterin-guanine dinucleotide biosynthesis adapter protein
LKVAAITGFSGAGKTTLLVQLIERYVVQGLRVGAIKHTHHHLSEENRGDTARFRAAGADPVILAGPGQAVIFASRGIARAAYERPRDLLVHFDHHDIVLVEGFRELGDWPQISISDSARPTVEELAANLDRIWRP